MFSYGTFWRQRVFALKGPRLTYTRSLPTLRERVCVRVRLTFLPGTPSSAVAGATTQHRSAQITNPELTGNKKAVTGTLYPPSHPAVPPKALRQE